MRWVPLNVSDDGTNENSCHLHRARQHSSKIARHSMAFRVVALAGASLFFVSDMSAFARDSQYPFSFIWCCVQHVYVRIFWIFYIFFSSSSSAVYSLSPMVSICVKQHGINVAHFVQQQRQRHRTHVKQVLYHHIRSQHQYQRLSKRDSYYVFVILFVCLFVAGEAISSIQKCVHRILTTMMLACVRI